MSGEPLAKLKAIYAKIRQKQEAREKKFTDLEARVKALEDKVG